jgi:hypothetical protein
MPFCYVNFNPIGSHPLTEIDELPIGYKRFFITQTGFGLRAIQFTEMIICGCREIHVVGWRKPILSLYNDY